MADRAPARSGGVFGFGLAGLVDGIVLHQVLQWHHLVSDDVATDTVAGLERNTLADGVFHLAVLGVLVAGTMWMCRVAARALPGWRRRMTGGALVGYGVFHLVDEITFHLLLDLHHIRMVESYLVYDLAFTAVGVAAIAAGLVVLRRARSPRGAS